MELFSENDISKVIEKYITKGYQDSTSYQISEEEEHDFESLPLEFNQSLEEFIIPDDASEVDNAIIDFIQDAGFLIPPQSIVNFDYPSSADTELNLDDETADSKSSVKSFPHIFCRKLLEIYNFKCCNDRLFVYDRNHGRYMFLRDSKLKVLIRQGWDDRIQAKLNKNAVLEIIERLKTEPEIQVDEDYFNCYPYLMNFWNGVLNLENGMFTAHSPEYRFTHCIQANYTTSPSGGKTFRRFIATVTQGDMQKEQHLQEVIGYMLSEYNTAKKAFMLIGQPHSGKSTLNRVLSTLVGSEHVANVPLHRLHERFILAHLSTMKVNICSEISDAALSNIEVFKAITGNDELVAEYKGKDHFTYKSKMKLLFSGNFMPILKSRDVTSAFFDRLSIINFNYTVPESERDHELEIKLLEDDRSFIVAWAVKGVKRLVENNFVFSESNESITFKEKYINDQNNTIDFINNHCIFGSNCRIHLRPLYATYIKYCHDNCFTAFSKNDFFAEISKHKVQKSKFRINGSQSLWGYIGIALQEEVQKKSA